MSAEANLSLARYDFRLPPQLSDMEVEVILAQVDNLVSWASDIKDYALAQAIAGKEWHDWKLVEGRSNRRYVNEEAVAKAVTEAGADPYDHQVKGITAMQRMLGRSKFEALLGNLVEKPQGKPVLVPISDKRPAIHNAKLDFEEENENDPCN